MQILIIANTLDMVLNLIDRIFSVDNEFGKNVIIFGVDMSSSIHVDRKRRIF